MPIALEPSRTYRYVLKSDRDKPKEDQPFFEFRYLSGRAWKEVAAVADDLENSAGGAAAIDSMYAMIKPGLVNWGNMIDPEMAQEIPFDLDELDRLLTMKETRELLEAFQNQGVGAEELKN